MIKKIINYLVEAYKNRVITYDSWVEAYKNRMITYDSWFDDLLSNSSSDKNKLTRALGHLLLVAAFSAIILLIINFYLHSPFFGATDSLNAGTFGDFFGGVLNPVFTFFTLFGLIITIVIQRQELKLARTEYEKTANALSIQAVESTFFNLLDLHHKISHNIKTNTESFRLDSERKSIKEILDSNEHVLQINYEEREVFEVILDYITGNEKDKEPYNSSQIIARYKEFQRTRNHILGHYFRNLYQALKIIHNYNEDIVTKENKKKYASILRAQLSTIELVFLFYNCLDDMCDNGKFKNLLIEYSMLEHLSVSEKNSAKGEYLIGGKYPIDYEMMTQYKVKSDLEGKNEIGYFGGAFGENAKIPPNLWII